MSDIYRVINPENNTEQLLVSKEYVDLRIRALKEAFNTHIQNIDNAHTNPSDKTIKNAALLDNEEIKDLEFKEENLDIPAENIKTDPSHRFVTQSQLEVFKSKPSSFEVEALINDAYNDMKNRFNEMYSKLLNMPDATKKLKEIASLLSNDQPVDNIIQSLASKIDEKDFEDHIESGIHLTNADRKALNILLGMIKDGTIDKVHTMSLDTVNTSLNSHALDGRNFDQVRSRGEFNKVYGIYGNCENQADYYFPKGEDLTKYINEEFIVNMIGKIIFRESKYYISNFFIERGDLKDLIISGCGSGSEFESDIIVCNNVQFENCSIKSRSMTIKNKVVFRNVEFNNTEIVMFESNMCKFIDCTFNKCSIVFYKTCRYNRFTDCLFNKTQQPKYIGGNNVFSGNIETI